MKITTATTTALTVAMTLALFLPQLTLALPTMTKTMAPVTDPTFPRLSTQQLQQHESKLFKKREMDLETPWDDQGTCIQMTTAPTQIENSKVVKLERREGLSAQDYMQTHSLTTLAADGSALNTAQSSIAPVRYDQEAKLALQRGPALT
ncbi:hypothetical protein BGZ83_004384 [Gryganskiella cystojenkinii]|nr:hypothetical protein BGZ83_004384 [Gryganskiella cystojenkinii]